MVARPLDGRPPVRRHGALHRARARPRPPDRLRADSAAAPGAAPPAGRRGGAGRVRGRPRAPCRRPRHALSTGRRVERRRDVSREGRACRDRSLRASRRGLARADDPQFGFVSMAIADDPPDAAVELGLTGPSDCGGAGQAECDLAGATKQGAWKSDQTCADGTFHDPTAYGGSCWACPTNFTRSLTPVTEATACWR